MYVDHRTYTFHPAKMPKWIALYEQYGLPVQQKYLGNLLGFFQTEIGSLNQPRFAGPAADIPQANESPEELRAEH